MWDFIFAGRFGSCFSFLSNVCWVCGRERSVKWGFRWHFMGNHLWSNRGSSPTNMTAVSNNACVTVQLKNWCWRRSCTLRLSRGRGAVLIPQRTRTWARRLVKLREAFRSCSLDRRRQLFAVWSPNALADLEADQKSFKKIISSDGNQFCVHLVGRYFFHYNS